jgi:hypothetical protein
LGAGADLDGAVVVGGLHEADRPAAGALGAFNASSSSSSWAESTCSIVRAPRRKPCTICTAVAPERGPHHAYVRHRPRLRGQLSRKSSRHRPLTRRSAHPLHLEIHKLSRVGSQDRRRSASPASRGHFTIDGPEHNGGFCGVVDPVTEAGEPRQTVTVLDMTTCPRHVCHVSVIVSPLGHKIPLAFGW